MQPQATGSLGQTDALRVLSIASSARMLTGALADVLGMPHGDLDRHLAEEPCLLPIPPGADARQLRGFLTALGLHVTDAGPHEELVDLCVHAKDGADPAALAEGLAPALQPHLHGADISLRDVLAGSAGLLLSGLSPDEADRLARRLRRQRQAVVMLSNRATALFDVFASDTEVAGLARHLRLLGHGEDPVTGALASGLDRRVALHLSRRFPKAMVRNRDFQRFDVLLTKVGADVSDDIADFLTARTGLPRDRFGLVTSAAPLRLEVALPRANALRFQRDYAAIGLVTHLDLV